MEDTKTTLYRDIVIESIGLEAYHKHGPNGLIILDEGVGDFLKGLVKAPINVIQKKIDERYARIEKIEKSYQQTLKKMGVDINSIDNEIKGIVKNNIGHVEKGLKTDDDSSVKKGFSGIKQDLISSKLFQALSHRLKEIDPEVWLPAIAIYTGVVVSKFIIMVVVAQFFGRFWEYNKNLIPTQKIYGLAKLATVVFLGPIIDHLGIILSIRSGKSGQYQIVANTANTVYSSYMIHSRLGGGAFKILLSRIWGMIAHGSAGYFIKHAEEMDDKYRYLIGFGLLFSSKIVDIMTFGGSLWQYPQDTGI